MRKMKNLILALLVATLMMPVMNAVIDSNTVLKTLTVDGNDILSTCVITEENGEEVYTCGYEAAWNATEVTIAATVDETKATIIEETKPNGPISLTANSTGTNIVVKNNNDESVTTSYNITITKAQAPAIKLETLGVTGYELSPAFDADAENQNYEVEVPYGTKKVTITATADPDSNITIGGIGEVEISKDGGVYQITATRNGETTYYSISIQVAENPMIATIEALIAADDTLKDKVSLYDLTETTAQFIYNSMLDNSVLVKQYNVTFESGSAAATIVAALKEVMKKDAEISMLLPNDGKVSDADIVEIKKDGGEILVGTESGVIFVLDGSKITDADKGFNAIVKVNEEIEKELFDKISKLLDPKDGGMIIDFENEGKLPTGTKVMIHAEGYGIGDLVSLYYYNPKTGKLELYKKNLKVEKFTIDGESENVVMVELDHTSSYVLLPAKNNAQTGVLNVVLYTIMALGSLAGIVFLLKKKAN